MIKISPSLLSADMSRLADAVLIVKEVADYVHCDVMDGHFVPNLTFGAPVVKALKKLNVMPLDVHLMIENPGKWLDDYFNAGLNKKDYLTFHFEAETEPEMVLKRIRDRKVKSGLAIKPGTPFEAVEHLLEWIDQILIMTVEPGFGGQKFMEDMLGKIRSARELIRPGQVIAIDGGINPDTARMVVRAGADFLIAGGSVYGISDPVRAIEEIKDALI